MNLTMNLYHVNQCSFLFKFDTIYCLTIVNDDNDSGPTELSQASGPTLAVAFISISNGGETSKPLIHQWERDIYVCSCMFMCIHYTLSIHHIQCQLAVSCCIPVMSFLLPFGSQPWQSTIPDFVRWFSQLEAFLGCDFPAIMAGYSYVIIKLYTLHYPLIIWHSC